MSLGEDRKSSTAFWTGYKMWAGAPQVPMQLLLRSQGTGAAGAAPWDADQGTSWEV